MGPFVRGERRRRSIGTPKPSDEEGAAPGAGSIRSTDGNGEITMVGRRRFLLLGIDGSAAALVGGTSLHAAAVSSTTAAVWRLSADWGYPVPPKNRTRCHCKACRNHANNKVFASKSAALANRVHSCCVCQPYSIDLLAADSAALFASNPSGGIDLRNRDTRGRFEAADLRSLAPVPDPPTRSMGTPPVGSSRVLAEAPSPAKAPVAEPSRAANLPVTGADHDAVLVPAGVLVVAGVAAAVASGSSTS